MLRFIPVWLAASLFVGIANADDNTPRFETHIAPLFQKHCVKCHNADQTKAELDLSSAVGVFRGGESGPIIEPGKPDESYLFELVHEHLMPPEDEPPLTAKQIEMLRDWIAAGSPLASGQDPRELSAADYVDNQQIEPLMLLRCGTCHGLRTQEGGLDLRTKASMLAGGKSGPAIVLGHPEQSLLLKRVHAGEMPPKERLIRTGVRPITDAEVDLLTRWIARGAPETRPVTAVDPLSDPLVSSEDREFWAFRPPRRPPLPEVDPSRIANPIDAFLLHRLQKAGLGFAPPAERAELLRRVYLDLTGLPPEPEAVRRFLDDDRPLAYERVVDRLLASPRYGERWSRFWLDAAGYADSEGKRSADPLRPHAYRYRDYVIRAFNADKPYRRFLLEQLAGDELVDTRRPAALDAAAADKLIATGFLRMAPDGTGSDIVNSVSERLEVIADEIDIFGSTVLGLTLKCARCHSHKYDPIPQRDYYRLAAVFKGAYDEHDWLKPSFVKSQTKDLKPGRVLPHSSAAEQRRYEQRLASVEGEIAEQRRQLEVLADSLRARHRDQQLAALPAELRSDLKRMLTTPAEQRDAVLDYLAGKFEKRLRLTDKQLASSGEYKKQKSAADKAIKQLEASKPAPPMIRALWDRGEPSPTYIYRRGDHRQPGRLVAPGVPSVLSSRTEDFVVSRPYPQASSTGRRLALARWLVKPDHPLTSRVMVNRLWRHHFGRGIVATIDNFGRLGERPTHPELLDWLAVEFVERDWSVKAMHRLIVTSRAYRQSSRMSGSEDVDPENKLVSRMPLRRMDAEQVRDAMLAVAGRLHERPFGRPDPVNVRKDGLVTGEPVRGGWRAR